MPLQLQTALPSDAPTLTQVFFSAFHPEDPFEALIYPFGATPKAMEHEYKSFVKSFKDPNVYHMKVVDDEILPNQDGNEIIACARWKIWKEERPQEIWDVSWKPDNPDLSKAKNGILDDVDVVFEQVFYNRLQEMRRKHIRGVPCAYMSMLCTRPTQQRRGAASMLLNWGIEIADREGLNVFAQASPMILSSRGASKLGFELVETWELNVEELGRNEPKNSPWPLRKALMKRSPLSGNSGGEEKEGTV